MCLHINLGGDPGLRPIKIPPGADPADYDTFQSIEKL